MSAAGILELSSDGLGYWEKANIQGATLSIRNLESVDIILENKTCRNALFPKVAEFINTTRHWTLLPRVVGENAELLSLANLSSEKNSVPNRHVFQ